MNTKKLMGYVTIGAIVGGTAYAIYKYKKQLSIKEDEIDLAQAQMIIRSREHGLPVITQDMTSEEIDSVLATTIGVEMTEEEMDNFREDTHETVNWNQSFIVKPEDRADYDPEKHDKKEFIEASQSIPNNSSFYDDVDFNLPLKDTITEEDKVLRFDPNSTDALYQFMKMEMAEWIPMEPVYQTLLRLYDFKFDPKNDGDHMLMTQIIDYRSEFFGMASKWTQNVTFADVVLHYARLTQYNVGGDIKHWTEMFLEHAGLLGIDDSFVIGETIEKHMQHTFFNEEHVSFGMFGLDRYAMDAASKVAGNNIDKSLTFEIEFNIFLQGCV